MDRCLIRGILFLFVALALTVTWSPASGVCYLMCPRGDNVVTDPDTDGTRTVDFNLDGAVGLVDFAAFGASFGAAGANCADFDCNKIVDLIDLARFGIHFGHAGAGFTMCVL